MSAAEYADQHIPALLPSLQASVPLRIWEIEGSSTRDLLWLAGKAVEHIAAHGDVLQYRTSEKRATAKAFNALTTGLAVLACFPGGVTFAGCHWCLDHEVCTGAKKPQPPAEGAEPARLRLAIQNVERPPFPGDGER